MDTGELRGALIATLIFGRKRFLPSKRFVARDPMPHTRDSLFGPPPVLTDERIDDYNECYQRVFDYFGPKDAIEERLARDYADHDWEVSRWRRKKSQMIDHIPEMYLDGVLVMLKRADRINELIERAEASRNRSYRDLMAHRQRVKELRPDMSEKKPRFKQAI
jgi:hypothetical protein